MSEIKEIERLSRMNEEDMYVYKEQQFLKIFRKAITKSKFYKQFYSDAGITLDDIKSLKDLIKLPILTKETLRLNTDLIPTVPKWQLISAKTSGTTGTPLRIYHSYRSIKKEQAYIIKNREQRGFLYGSPIVSIRGNLFKSIPKLKLHLSNTLYISSFNLKSDNIEDYYSEIIKFKPRAIEGYPSSLYNLCLYLIEKKLCLTIPIAFTSSETLNRHQRDLIEKTLNTEIFDYYGTTERSISLIETMDHQGYIENPGYSINEYFENSIVTTSLIKERFPLIRYEVNDNLKLEDPNLKTPIIKKIEGRKEDIVIAKDGSRIGRLDHIFKGAKNIENAQIIQEEKGTLIINIVTSKGFTEEDKNIIEKKAYDLIGKNNMTLRIVQISHDQLLYTASNKFKFVISKMHK
ncbi:phenylacetate--CoA ligase family protein [Arenibacter sp. ARW7G5Y1]|uniref:phenylacetate--CoA ligase family protein n=1 Tax=Arenibacter sp. ARW7G5Y1 TaxID=2135619 RepID=UPI0011B651DA|nr:phenylacetate--CoA ligase family protein [Arenibacter sp. ARW7G5Y1]